ncbi:UPF0605 protein GA14893-like [Ischnura elegans]|uniref:UPF0605 protein GA14893-like n=1 Tax=Ischnura elegans TaxID=197161 RepID=UPI001ED890B2|nr:UPF0605 protein GA14893-like [Ischnura elegans]
MDYGDVFDLTPEPHFIPGYTGHCAHYRYRIGETYGHATHKALMQPVSCEYNGHLVITDIQQGVSERPAMRDVRSLEERSRDLQAVYKVPFVPGYQGFVPRIGGTLGERFNVAATEAVSEFVETRRADLCRRQQLQREASGGGRSNHSMGGRTPLMEVKPEFRGLRKVKSQSEQRGEHPYSGIWPGEQTACPHGGRSQRRPHVSRTSPRCTVNLPPIDEMEEQPREEWYQDPRHCFHQDPNSMSSRCAPQGMRRGGVCPQCSPGPSAYGSCGLPPHGERPHQPLHPRPPPKNECAGGRFVLADIRPDIAAGFFQDVPCPEPSFLPDHSTSPYFMEIGNPDKTFKNGFAGHVPFSASAFGQSHDAQVRSQLAEFTSNYRRRQSQEWAPVEIGGIESFPKVSAGPVIYPTHVGLIPKYGGHVPGETFRFGRTYGNATRDAKSWLRGDFS